MKDQIELFGPPAPNVKADPSFAMNGYQPHTHARSTDPSTSTRAAERAAYRAGTAKARLLQVYREAGAGGLTDEEAGLLAGLAAGAWKRCSDLRADGLIVPVGEKMGTHGTPVRICAVVA